MEFPASFIYNVLGIWSEVNECGYWQIFPLLMFVTTIYKECGGEENTTPSKSDQRLVWSGKPGLITCLNLLWGGWIDTVSYSIQNSSPSWVLLLMLSPTKKTLWRGTSHPFMLITYLWPHIPKYRIISKAPPIHKYGHTQIWTYTDSYKQKIFKWVQWYSILNTPWLLRIHRLYAQPSPVAVRLCTFSL